MRLTPRSVRAARHRDAECRHLAGRADRRDQGGDLGHAARSELEGAFLILKHAIPARVTAKRGTLVGIASLGSRVGQPGSAAYAARKWGLRGLLESAALEPGTNHIRVSLVYPHNINSTGRAIAPGSEERDRNLEPAEVAELLAWICAAPGHVSVSNATVWPTPAGIWAQLWGRGACEPAPVEGEDGNRPQGSSVTLRSVTNEPAVMRHR